MQHLKIGMLVASTLLLMSCASVQIRPIEGTDFYLNDKGDYCMSAYYLNNILKAKVK